MVAVPRKGTRVRFQVEQGDDGLPRGMTGVVTYQRGRTIRLVDSTGRRYMNGTGGNVALTMLKPVGRFGCFVFDTRLDKSLFSERQAARFWQEYCASAGWNCATERFHSVADLRYFLGRTIPQDVLVFSGHGHDVRGFRLSNGEKLDGSQDLKVAPANHDKVVLFSSCLLGRNEKICRKLLEAFHARALISYTSDVYDEMTYIAEPLLLQMLAAGRSPQSATEQVAEALDPWKTLNRRRARKFPLVCFER
jgi:hypothetical protein